MRETPMKLWLVSVPVFIFLFILSNCGTPSEQPPIFHSRTYAMYNVGIHIPINDFKVIAQIGIPILVPSWGMEQNSLDIRDFLDKADVFGLKVVLDGGYSAKAWGYDGLGPFPSDQVPELQTDIVQTFVNTFKSHPALYGWQICYAGGAFLPNGLGNDLWPKKTAIKLEQLKELSDLVRQSDPYHPQIIHMIPWNDPTIEDPFGLDNPFEAGIVQYVILDLFSNYSSDGLTPDNPNFVSDIGKPESEVIVNKDPMINIWGVLASFQELPEYLLPSPDDLKRDFKAINLLPSLQNIGFFGWGEPESDFYLPDDEKGSVKLLNEIQDLISQ